MEKAEEKKEKKVKEKSKEPSLEEQLAIKDSEIQDWKNKYYMAYADMDNLRKKYEKEHSDVLKYRAMGFIENLMPVLDGFHAALQLEVDDQKVKNFLVGFEYIYKQFLNALEEEGVSKLEPLIDTPFNESYMHAIEVQEVEGEPNRVIKVLSCGYKLKDRVIRPASVIVSKKKEEKKSDSEESLNKGEN